MGADTDGAGGGLAGDGDAAGDAGGLHAGGHRYGELLAGLAGHRRDGPPWRGELNLPCGLPSRLAQETVLVQVRGDSWLCVLVARLALHGHQDHPDGRNGQGSQCHVGDEPQPALPCILLRIANVVTSPIAAHVLTIGSKPQDCLQTAVCYEASWLLRQFS